MLTYRDLRDLQLQLNGRRQDGLSALLSGRALEVYSRLSEEAAQDYDRVKLALMK